MAEISGVVDRDHGLQVIHRADRDQSSVISAGHLTVVASVRVDNRASLLRSLPGSAGRSTDAGLLLEAWRHWGEGICSRLVGEYSFVVWDDIRRSLFGARDVSGTRPMFYWLTAHGGLGFSSSPAPALSSGDLDRCLNQTAAIDQLLSLTSDRERTLLSGLRRLPPGHSFTFAPGRSIRVREEANWRPDGTRHAKLTDWAVDLGNRIEQAVQDRLGTSRVVGSHLSGGLDSAAITAVASRVAGERRIAAISFSAEPTDLIDGRRPVDASFICDTAETSNVAVHYHDDDDQTLDEAFARAAPGMMPPAYSTSDMHRWAAAQGVDRMFSGWGGDEGASFNGRSHMSAMVRRGRVASAVKSYRNYRGRGAVVSRRRFLVQNVVEPFIPDPLRWRFGSRLSDPVRERLPSSIVNERLACDLGVEDRLRHPLRTRPDTQATQLALLNNGHLVDRVEGWAVDAARFGVEYVHPLLDQRVVALALAVPSEAFVHDGYPRWLFRQAVAPDLPASVAWRLGKQDSFVDRRQARRAVGGGDGQRTEAAVQALLDDDNDLGGVLDLGKVRRALRVVQESDRSPSSTVGRGVPYADLLVAVRLAKYVEHNRIST